MPNWPVGWEVRLPVAPKALPVGAELKPLPNGAPVAVGESENMVALNGLAAPANPVACGRSPAPTLLPARKLDPAPVG